MKIEEGKYYRTRDGRKVGPMQIKPTHSKLCGEQGSILSIWYVATGRANSLRETPNDLVAEWIDEPKKWADMTPQEREAFQSKDTTLTIEPKLWRDMTPEEKGALLLAHHEGKVIEFCRPRGTPDCPAPVWTAQRPIWTDELAYRVRPERETVELVGADFGKGASVIWRFSQRGFYGKTDHRIIFEIVDGEPDCASIRMEKITKHY